jgi:hypothetical protein
MQSDGDAVTSTMAKARATSNRLDLARARSLTGLAAVLALGGCANLPSGPFAQPPADVTSPIAAELRAANPAGAPYPSFLQVPEAPQDVRPTTAWTRNIYNTLRLRRQMRAVAVMYPQSLYGAEAFAKEARSKAAPPVTPAEAAAQTAKTQRDAKALRDQAKAPAAH